MKMTVVVCHIEDMVDVGECQIRAWTAEVKLQAVKCTELSSTKAHARFEAQIISLPND